MMGCRREYRPPRPGEISAFLSAHAGWIKSMGNVTGNGEELRFRPCPKCGHDKPENPAVQINTQSGLWRCFACNATGNWFTLTRAFGNPLPENDRYVDGGGGVDVSAFARARSRERRPVTGNHYPGLLKYCHDRGIGDETLNAFRVSTKGPHALRWPMFAWTDDGWVMANARIRVCTDKTARVRDFFEIRGGPTGLMIGTHTIDFRGPRRAIIFEGQWDVMTAWEMGMRNVFSLPNGANNIRVAEMLRYIPNDWEIWLAMDGDAAGRSAVEKFFAQLGPERVAVLRLPEKDLNDWWMASGQKITVDDFEKCATGVTSMVGGAQQNNGGFMEITMDDMELMSPDPIAITPWDKLNFLLGGGFRPGETTGVLAPSGVGKTTWCNHVAVHNCTLRVNVGLVSLEGPRDALKRKISDVVRGSATREQYPDVLSRLRVSALHGSTTTWQQCLAEFHAMADSGCELFILDNLDFITRNNENDKLTAYAAFLDFAKQKNAHVVVVWQPNKIDRGVIVNSGNQKGYAQTFQDADNYINLNIIDDFVRVEVEKCREKGVDRTINHCWYIYHKETRMFEELRDDNQFARANKCKSQVIPLSQPQPVVDNPSPPT